MFVLTLTDDKLLKFVLILGGGRKKVELRLFGEKSLAGSEPLLTYYYGPRCAWSVRHDLEPNIFPSGPPT